MKLTDLLPLEQWMEIEQEIYKMSGLSTNVFDTQGVRISDFLEWTNELCPEIKATDKGQSFICAVAHMNLAAQAVASQKTVIDECDAGVLKIVVPILVKGEYIGSIGACGMLLDNGIVDDFLVSKITDIDEDDVLRYAESLSSISTEDALKICRKIESRIASSIQDYNNKTA